MLHTGSHAAYKCSTQALTPRISAPHRLSRRASVSYPSLQCVQSCMLRNIRDQDAGHDTFAHASNRHVHVPLAPRRMWYISNFFSWCAHLTPQAAYDAVCWRFDDDAGTPSVTVSRQPGSNQQRAHGDDAIRKRTGSPCAGFQVSRLAALCFA